MFLHASTQQPLLLESGSFHYMEIIPFPQSSFGETLHVRLLGASGSKACARSRVTRADDGQLNTT